MDPWDKPKENGRGVPCLWLDTPESPDVSGDAGDILSEDSPRSGLIWDAMKQLAKHDGHSVLVLIREGSIDSLLERLGAHEPVIDRKEQYVREYGVGAQILVHQGVKHMRLITNTMPKLIGLEAYDLSVAGITPLIKGPK